MTGNPRTFILIDIQMGRIRKICYREFFLILVPASFSIAAVSTLFSVTSLWLRMALSTNPLPVSFRIISVVNPTGLPTAPAEISAQSDEKSVQMRQPGRIVSSRSASGTERCVPSCLRMSSLPFTSSFLISCGAIL